MNTVRSGLFAAFLLAASAGVMAADKVLVHIN